MKLIVNEDKLSDISLNGYRCPCKRGVGCPCPEMMIEISTKGRCTYGLFTLEIKDAKDAQTES